MKIYNKLSVIYDAIMEHVDYAGWADYIDKLLNRFHVPGKQILEHACGTGSLALQLAAKGYRVSACDQSAYMIKLAQKKNIQHAVKVSFKVASMETPSHKKKFAAVLALYDSVNYLTNADLLQRAFNFIKTQLLPGGLFVFDISTEFNSINHFTERHYYDEGKNFAYMRYSDYDHSARMQKNNFTFFLKNGGHRYLKFKELHVQRIYQIAEIESVLKHCRLKLLSKTDGFTMRQAHARSERVHFTVTPIHDKV